MQVVNNEPKQYFGMAVTSDGKQHYCLTDSQNEILTKYEKLENLKFIEIRKNNKKLSLIRRIEY